MDIAAWLRGLGLERYEQAFRDNDVDGEVLRKLTAEDLIAMGVASVGHRRKLLQAIAVLEVSPSTDAAVDDEARGAPAGARPGEPGPAGAERRQLTVMFADLVGSTGLAERLDPEDLRELLRRYQGRLAETIGRFGGHVAKYLGDGVLAYFGWPKAHEDAAERAVRAALALTREVADLYAPDGTPLAARVGIATGLVVVGDLIGAEEARERSVVGETPNLAARLQAFAEPGHVVVASSTRRLLGALFEYDDLGPLRLHGLTERIRAFRILGPGRTADRFEARQASAVAELVGREQELALLLERWRRAKDGEAQLVLLVGEAGIGKSRLVRALRDAVAGEPNRRLLWLCSPFHTDSALWPVVQQLSAAASLRPDAPTEQQLDRIEALIAEIGADIPDAVPLLAALLGIEAAPRHPTPALTPSQARTRTLAVLAELIVAQASRQPVLVVVEDAHWSDPTTLELVDELLEQGRRARLLLLVTSRPEAGTSRLAAAPSATMLTLSRLPRTAVERMIRDISGGKALPEALVERIAARADGVPLFVEELTRTVLESGVVRETENAYVAEAELADAAIPLSLHDSLMARLDRFAALKDVAQMAACIGREFDHALLAALSALSDEELGAALERLVEAGILQRRGGSPEAGYTFRHALLRDVAYESLLRARRQELHRRLAMLIGERFPERAEIHPELLAHHCSQGGLAARAAELWLEAGERAKARYANLEAARRLESCLQELDHLDDDGPAVRARRREVLVMLGDLGGLAGELERSNDLYQQALALADEAAERAVIDNKLHRPASATRDGATIAYYEHGSGPRTLLFVNPIVYGLAIFQPLLERLCQEYRVITVDCRGTGRSSPLTRPYSLERHAEDVRAVIEAAGPPVIGVGISRGGNQLLRVAHRRPELFEQLVTIGMPIGRTELPPPLGPPEDYLAQRWRLLREGDVPGLVRLQSEFVHVQPEERDVANAFVERSLRLPPETLLSFFDPDPTIDIGGIMAEVAVPTVLMHGSADRLNPPAVGEHIAAHMPNARLYVFEGRGHLPIYTATDEFCAVLRRFVATGEPT